VYFNFLGFKYRIKHSHTDLLGGAYSSDTECCNRSVNRFFFKPHIGILEYLVPDRKNIVAYGENDVHNRSGQENFDIIIWKLATTNKHPIVARTAFKCHAKAYWDFLEQENDLVWKSKDEEPNECNISTNPELDGDGFQQRIGYAYSEILKSIGANPFTIPGGFSKEIYLLLTINNHDIAYLILDNNQFPNWDNERNILLGRCNDQFLCIRFNQTYRFRVRFDCRRFSERKYHMYTINIKSWDNIEFTKSR
jgi:hypothetical protein